MAAQGNPLQNQKLFGFGYFWEGPNFKKKKSKIFEKSLTWCPNQIATRDLVKSKFEPHGLQRSPKALFTHPLGSCVAPAAHGVQRSRVGA